MRLTPWLAWTLLGVAASVLATCGHGNAAIPVVCFAVASIHARFDSVLKGIVAALERMGRSDG